jgi:hypothetical protein
VPEKQARDVLSICHNSINGNVNIIYLLLVRMLLTLKSLVKRSTGDVNVRNDVRRCLKNSEIFWLFQHFR